LLLLFDGDIGRYRWAFAAEKTQYLVELVNASGHREFTRFDTKKGADEYGERVTKNVNAHYIVWSRKDIQPVENALQIAKSSLSQTIQDVMEQFGVEPQVRIFISGKSNFREHVAVTKPYKGNRDSTPRPVHYEAVGTYLVGNWGAEVVEGIEADDAIGIAAMEAKDKKQRFVVVSNDKDLDQIPGMHYDWIKKKFYEVSAKEARTSFYQQLLSGDSTDNVPGLPGIGSAKAAQALAECKTPKECFEVVWNMYKDILGTRGPLTEREDAKYLVEQADLVYILKRPDEPWSKTKEGAEFVFNYITHSDEALGV